MLSKYKAGKMLKEGVAHGKPLTKKQKGLFGLIRGGKKPQKMSATEEAVKKATV